MTTRITETSHTKKTISYSSGAMLSKHNQTRMIDITISTMITSLTVTMVSVAKDKIITMTIATITITKDITMDLLSKIISKTTVTIGVKIRIMVATAGINSVAMGKDKVTNLSQTIIVMNHLRLTTSLILEDPLQTLKIR